MKNYTGSVREWIRELIRLTGYKARLKQRLLDVWVIMESIKKVAMDTQNSELCNMYARLRDIIINIEDDGHKL